MDRKDTKQMVIYGCGVNGISLFYTLKDRMDILFFVDKNPMRNGYIMEGISCISYDEFLKCDKNVNIIVSLEYPDTTIEDLKKHGFFNVYESSGFLNCRKGACEYKEIQEIIRMKTLLDNGLQNAQIVYDTQDFEIRSIVEDYKVRKNECCLY